MYYTPDYYGKFRCVADSCPESCCAAGWLIPLDDEVCSRYRELGIDIDGGSEIDTEGDRVFKLRGDGTCVWFKDGLCELYSRTGFQGEICDKFPRFFEDYDGFGEAGISVSCPEAGSLVLGYNGNPYIGAVHCTPDELLNFLLEARKKVFEELYSDPDPDRFLLRLYGYALRLQELIDEDRLDRLGVVTFDKSMELPFDIIDARKFILSKTEPLSERWPELMKMSPCDSGTPDERRNYLAYLVYRRFLKAINTEDIATECGYIALLYRLAATLPDYAGGVMMISREIEHDDENVEKLWDYVWQAEGLN